MMLEEIKRREDRILVLENELNGLKIERQFLIESQNKTREEYENRVNEESARFNKIYQEKARFENELELLKT